MDEETVARAERARTKVQERIEELKRANKLLVLSTLPPCNGPEPAVLGALVPLHGAVLGGSITADPDPDPAEEGAGGAAVAIAPTAAGAVVAAAAGAGAPGAIAGAEGGGGAEGAPSPLPVAATAGAGEGVVEGAGPTATAAAAAAAAAGKKSKDFPEALLPLLLQFLLEHPEATINKAVDQFKAAHTAVPALTKSNLKAKILESAEYMNKHRGWEVLAPALAKAGISTDQVARYRGDKVNRAIALAAALPQKNEKKRAAGAPGSAGPKLKQQKLGAGKPSSATADEGEVVVVLGDDGEGPDFPTPVPGDGGALRAAMREAARLEGTQAPGGAAPFLPGIKRVTPVPVPAALPNPSSPAVPLDLHPGHTYWSGWLRFEKLRDEPTEADLAPLGVLEDAGQADRVLGSVPAAAVEALATCAEDGTRPGGLRKAAAQALARLIEGLARRTGAVAAAGEGVPGAVTLSTVLGHDLLLPTVRSLLQGSAREQDLIKRGALLLQAATDLPEVDAGSAAAAGQGALRALRGAVAADRPLLTRVIALLQTADSSVVLLLLGALRGILGDAEAAAGVEGALRAPLAQALLDAYESTVVPGKGKKLAFRALASCLEAFGEAALASVRPTRNFGPEAARALRNVEGTRAEDVAAFLHVLRFALQQALRHAGAEPNGLRSLLVERPEVARDLRTALGTLGRHPDYATRLVEVEEAVVDGGQGCKGLLRQLLQSAGQTL